MKNRTIRNEQEAQQLITQLERYLPRAGAPTELLLQHNERVEGVHRQEQYGSGTRALRKSRS